MAIERKTLKRPVLPNYRREELPDEVVKWHTRNEPGMWAIAFYWPAEIRTVLIYSMKDGLTQSLIELHFHRCVEPMLRQRLQDAPCLGLVQ